MTNIDNFKEIAFKFHEKEESKCIFIKVDEDSSILDLKETLSKNHQHDQVELLFCGNIMQNSKHLKDYNIGKSTVVHVVPITITKKLNKVQNSKFMVDFKYTFPYLTGFWLHRKNTAYISLLQPSINLDLNQESKNNSTESDSTYYEANITPHNFYPTFYVYCKDKCQDIVPGKLRVKCKACSGSEILLNQEPSSWNDISPSKEVFCTCFSKRCCQNLSIAEFYFKCSNGLCNKTSTVPIKCIKTNIDSKECCICEEISDPVIQFECVDKHCCCLECFITCARLQLKERHLSFSQSRGYNVPCPCGCPNTSLNDPHVFYLLGQDEYKMYQEIATEVCLLRGMDGFICPNPKCGMGLFKEYNSKMDSKHIKCCHCGHEFCSDCKENFHGNNSCRLKVENIADHCESYQNYVKSLETINETSKPCPKCKAPTERNLGCMHMTCVACKFDWCWNCCEEWNIDCQSNHWFG